MKSAICDELRCCAELVGEIGHTRCSTPTSVGTFLTPFACAERWRNSSRSGSKSPPIQTTFMPTVVVAREIAPVKIAAGEHVPNRVMFKNFLHSAGALSFVQADCTRLAGMSEFLTVSLLAKKFGLPVTSSRWRHGAVAPTLGSVQSHRDGTRSFVLGAYPTFARSTLFFLLK